MIGYNYVFKRSKWKIEEIKKKLKGFDVQEAEYGLFFKGEDYDKIMEELGDAELLRLQDEDQGK